MHVTEIPPNGNTSTPWYRNIMTKHTVYIEDTLTKAHIVVKNTVYIEDTLTKAHMMVNKHKHKPHMTEKS